MACTSPSPQPGQSPSGTTTDSTDAGRRYGRDGISLAMARERLSGARRGVSEGRSPAIEKQREKRRTAQAKTFGEFAGQWPKDARMADTTRSMRKSILDRDITPAFESRLMCEVSADDLRALWQKIKARGAPATAVHARDIVKHIYAFANLHGEKVPNPADEVGAASIATFVPKDRALSPSEIRLMHRQMEMVATYPTTRLALRMILLTLVRKSELIHATWDEVDFEAAVWTIPKSRMKGRRAHNVYLNRP
jgi:integrase